MIWHSTPTTEVLNNFSVDDKLGLLNSSLEERFNKYGKNIASTLEKPTFLERFLNQFKSKTTFALIVVALISLIASIALAKFNLSALLIIAIVLLNALISAYYINKCDLTLDKINQYSNSSTVVLRDGVIKKISSIELVPGDIIILEEGDYIPADARIIEANEFRCNESILTGVEVPVEKNPDAVLDEIISTEHRINMVFSGTTVVHGNAKAVVVATGFETEIGKAEAILEQTGDKKLPLQEKLDSLSKITNVVILCICLFVFFIGIIQNFHSKSFAEMTLGMLLNSVALAVAAIPEGLPTITTVVIAIGVQRILTEKIIIKDAKAAEILGKIDVLCCDKTGVFTRNKMSVAKIYCDNEIFETKSQEIQENAALVLRLATACSTLENDSTELAIQKACLAYNSASKQDIAALFPKIAVVPFDSARKTMTVITMINHKAIAIVKGAPEFVIPNCVGCNKSEILAVNDDFAANQLRNICIAIKQLDEIPANPLAEEIEKDLTFVGLIGIEDEPRENVVLDIKACDRAGIKTVMITGDNLLTAKSVARRIGILKNGTFSISGLEIAQMTDQQLAENIEKYTVFARVSPEDKARIIKAFKSKNLTVAVTGDSVEDAEALELADVGFSIGKFGADVAKGKADVIISNNRFSSIVYAIKESRGLFHNIKKSVYYLFSCNIAEILSSFIGMLIFRTFPVSAVQLLWINLLTDSAPALSLSMDNSDNEVMVDKEVLNSHKIFDLRSVLSLVLQGIAMTVTTLIAYAIGKNFGANTALTMAFATLSLSQIFHCFNNKFTTTLFGKNVFANKFMNFSIFITAFIILFLIFTPAGYLFDLTILNFTQFIISLGLALIIFPVAEVLKFAIKKIKK